MPRGLNPIQSALAILSALAGLHSGGCFRKEGNDLKHDPVASSVRPALMSYNSNDDRFDSWLTFSEEGNPKTLISRPAEAAGTDAIVQIASVQGRGVGINKIYSGVRGVVTFEYALLQAATKQSNAAVFVIPMANSKSGFVEAGARLAYTIEPSALSRGDLNWIKGSIVFDFTALPQAAYSIVALRLNENAPSRAAGRVLFRNIKINDKGEVAR